MQNDQLIKCEVTVKNMTLDRYIEWYNIALYPLNYPYKLRSKLVTESDKVSLIVSIAIPVQDNEDGEHRLFDILEIKGDNDNEVIDTFQKIVLLDDLKGNFRTVWDK